MAAYTYDYGFIRELYLLYLLRTYVKGWNILYSVLKLMKRYQNNDNF